MSSACSMNDVSCGAYSDTLRKYDIVLYRDSFGFQPFKTICREFASYDEARRWAANAMHNDSKARSVNTFFHY